MSVQTDTRRPSPVAGIAFDVERPQTLEAVLAFVRRYLTPEQVFTEDELDGFGPGEKERLEDRIDDLESELEGANDEADDARSHADDLEGEIADLRVGLRKLGRQIEGLRRLAAAAPLKPSLELRAEVPRGTEAQA